MIAQKFPKMKFFRFWWPFLASVIVAIGDGIELGTRLCEPISLMEMITGIVIFTTIFLLLLWFLRNTRNTKLILLIFLASIADLPGFGRVGEYIGMAIGKGQVAYFLGTGLILAGFLVFAVWFIKLWSWIFQLVSVQIQLKED